MKKLVIMGLMATFMLACTAPEISINDHEEYGTEKSKSVNSKGSSAEDDIEDELDITEN